MGDVSVSNLKYANSKNKQKLKNKTNGIMNFAFKFRVLLAIVILSILIIKIVAEDNFPPFNPRGPLVKCSYLSWEFIRCNEPEDLKGNKTAKESGFGCIKFGGMRYEDVERTKVWCSALDNIECYGNRTFAKSNIPCIKYSEQYFTTTLLYSILLGFLGMDRFCLGQTGTAVGKLLTIGGVGIWWIVDIILLVTNNLVPEDGSNWNPYV